MPVHLNDKEKLAEFIQKIGAEPREVRFDDNGNLTTLNLVGLHLTQLPSTIGDFSNLQKLLLGNYIEEQNIKKDAGNDLKSLPSEITKLQNLQVLTLAKNNLTTIPPEIWQLKNLYGLTLANNFLTSIPSEIGQLTKLEWLSFRDNALTELPSSIGNLCNLRALGFRNNKITKLPPEIGNLSNLEEIWLNTNCLTELPPEFARLTKLRTLKLGENPLRTPPPEIVGQGISKISEFFKDLEKGSITRYEAKLLIVGEGQVGKSCLLRSLQGEPFKELPTTHGIDIQPFQLVHPDSSEQIITLNVWDFGGQQIYHSTHQFFMTKRSLYLLVWNARGETEQARLDHWLRNIQVLAPEAPVLLVATHIDERPEDFNYERYKEAYPQLAGHIGVSNATGEGIENLKAKIALEAAQLPLMEQQWPQTWVKAEMALKNNSKYHIDFEEYTTICREQGVSREIASTALGSYLHDLGKILYYQDDNTLSNFIVLKPNWLTQAISRVLDDTMTRVEKKGILEHSELPRIWNNDNDKEHTYEPHLYPLFLKLMKRFLMSFELESDSNDGRVTQSLVPLLLPHTPPTHIPNWTEILPGQPEINMRFYLSNFVPPGLMSWFIVLTHLYTKNLHWREGVRLQYEGQEAHVELNPSTHEIWLRVKGSAPGNFFNILQHTIHDRILKRYFEGLRYKREVPCNCHLAHSKEEPCSYFHDYEKLAERLKKGKLTAECGESFEEVDVPVLLEGIHYTTNDRVILKIEENHKLLEKLASKSE